MCWVTAMLPWLLFKNSKWPQVINSTVFNTNEFTLSGPDANLETSHSFHQHGHIGPVSLRTARRPQLFGLWHYLFTSCFQMSALHCGKPARSLRELQQPVAAFHSIKRSLAHWWWHPHSVDLWETLGSAPFNRLMTKPSAAAHNTGNPTVHNINKSTL